MKNFNSSISKVLCLSALFLLFNLNKSYALTSQTISFTAISTKAARTLGAPTTFTITATAQSALNVTFVATTGASLITSIGAVTNTAGVCTATVTLTGNTLGNITITASQAGDLVFAAAPDVTQSFVVVGQANTITYPTISTKTLVLGAALTFTPTAGTATSGTVTYTATGTALASINASTGQIVTNTTGGTITATATVASPGAGYATPLDVVRTFSVNKTANTITYPTIASQTLVLGAALTFTPTAGTATSGTVTYTATGSALASINASSGQIITNTAGGTITVIAAVASPVAGYNTPTSISRTFTVNQTANTITYATIATQTLVAGAALTFTPTAATATNGTVSYTASGTALASINASSGQIITNTSGGTILVTASVASPAAGYATPTPVTRSFLVDKTNNIITYPVIANKTLVAGAALTFTPTVATATNGTVAYSATGTALASINASTGQIITNTSGGTITVTAAVASPSAGYETPASVSRTFTVSKTANTITYASIGNKTLVSGAALTFTPTAATVTNGTITYSASGTAFASINSGTGAITTNTAGGTITVTATASAPAAGYETAAPVSRTFTVSKTTNTITFPAIANKLLVAGAALTFTPSAATATSGTVAYTATGTALASINASTGQIITNTAGGTITVTAAVASPATGYLTPTPVSKTFTVNKTTNTITFPTIANQTLVAGAALTFTPTAATAISGTVAYTATGTALASINASTGQIITNTAGGTITVTAAVASPATGYNTPTSVSKTFTVNKTANTIMYNNIANQTMAGGALTFTPTAAIATSGTVSYSASGAALGSINSTTGAITSNTSGGSITVTASVASPAAGYATPTSVSKTFTVSKGTQTIVWTAITSKVTTDSPFTVTATNTSAGTSGAITISVVSGPATVSGNTVTLTGVVGTVVLQASAAATTTYNLTTKNQSFTVTVPPSLLLTSVESLSNNENFMIYPNPSKGLVFIKSERALKTILVYDVVGKVMLNEAISNALNNKEIDMTSFPKGIYFIRLESDNSSSIKKVVIN